jgi:hypothetical protein
VLPFRWCLTTSLESVQPVPAPDDLAGLVAELRFRLLLQREKKRGEEQTGKRGRPGALETENEKRKSRNQEKERKFFESKQFACGGLYFKRLANCMLKE